MGKLAPKPSRTTLAIWLASLKLLAGVFLLIAFLQTGAIGHKSSPLQAVVLIACAGLAIIASRRRPR